MVARNVEGKMRGEMRYARRSETESLTDRRERQGGERRWIVLPRTTRKARSRGRVQERKITIV